MRKICLIGNSHLAVLKLGWPQIQAQFSSMELVFFAVAGLSLQLEIVGGKLVAPDERIRKRLAVTSERDGDIEPGYDAFSDYEDGNSHHPLGSVKAGELLIKQTYEALRKSPIWESSMLIVTYDEHGGFYDHVVPPSDGVPSPDGINSPLPGDPSWVPPFSFDRLGVRVPVVLVSPCLDPGVRGPSRPP